MGWPLRQDGVWAGFVVGEVEHRLRFIPGDTFTMGSPPGEIGRYPEEEQREVEVPDFWLGETPVTQALYHVVTGENPSKFQSEAVPWLCADRPVEQVSFHDAQAFIEKVNGDKPGLELELPSEEAWEYACRAGTRTATYAGDLETEEGRSAVLDHIAWYRENSREAFDLSGFPLADLIQASLGTHRVGRLAPNAFGLYDMLGNVWEMCDTERGARRVVRGGTWLVTARLCRAAFRNGVLLYDRHDDLGFRVSRGQAPASSRPDLASGRAPRPPSN